MRLFISTLAAISMVLIAGSASALVSVSHSSAADGTTLLPGDTFTVDVAVSWDGAGTLSGVFSSTGFDDSVVQFVSADWFGLGETASSVFDVFPPPVFLPGLGRLGGISFAGDPASLVRTVQYGIAPPGSANALGAAANVLITTLTFEAVGGGSTTIGTVFGTADVGAAGDAFDGGADVVVNVVPEPGTALLMGLGLAGLAAAGRRE